MVTPLQKRSAVFRLQAAKQQLRISQGKERGCFCTLAAYTGRSKPGAPFASSLCWHYSGSSQPRLWRITKLWRWTRLASLLTLPGAPSLLNLLGQRHALPPGTHGTCTDCLHRAGSSSAKLMSACVYHRACDSPCLCSCRCRLPALIGLFPTSLRGLAQFAHQRCHCVS